MCPIVKDNDFVRNPASEVCGNFPEHAALLERLQRAVVACCSYLFCVYCFQHGDADVFKVLIANKSDKLSKVVTDEEGAALAKRFKMPFFVTSAKTNTNVEQVGMLTMCRSVALPCFHQHILTPA